MAPLLLNARSSGEHIGEGKMMLKITKIQESRNDVLLKLEGKITEQWATLLDGVCRSYLRQKKAVHLDCSHVDFIDARGVEVLNSLPRTQVTLMSAPGFVSELLQIGGRS
jgi:ABC-type transporter Mla MlaB component